MFLQKKSIDNLSRELANISAGRANSNLLNGVTVDYYGAPTPVQQLASINVPEARLLVISPYDKSSVGNIEKAINAANLGVNPLRRSSVSAGTEILITSPSLEGFTPKLAALIAFSIFPTELLSYGEITSILVISPYDKSSVGNIEKAINAANLGVNPSSDGEVIRISVPALTEERRKGFTPKLAALIAFSIFPTELLSYGDITSKRASGTLMLANC